MRQLLVVCPADGSVWADVMIDVRSMTYAEIDARRGWTSTLAEARSMLGDAARYSPPGATVYLVELVGRPARASSSGKARRYPAEAWCRVLHTIEVPSTDAAAAA